MNSNDSHNNSVLTELTEYSNTTSLADTKKQLVARYQSKYDTQEQENDQKLAKILSLERETQQLNLNI